MVYDTITDYMDGEDGKYDKEKDEILKGLKEIKAVNLQKAMVLFTTNNHI